MDWKMSIRTFFLVVFERGKPVKVPRSRRLRHPEMIAVLALFTRIGLSYVALRDKMNIS